MIKHILLGILALLVLAKLFTPGAIPSMETDINIPLPEFSLQTLDGNGMFKSSELGKGTFLLTFMSYTCPYCTKQSKYFGDNKLELPIYLISVDNDKSGVEKWHKENNIKSYYKKFGIIGSDIANKLEVRSIPMSFIIKDGVVIKRIIGMVDSGRLNKIKY